MCVPDSGIGCRVSGKLSQPRGEQDGRVTPSGMAGNDGLLDLRVGRRRRCEPICEIGGENRGRHFSEHLDNFSCGVEVWAVLERLYEALEQSVSQELFSSCPRDDLLGDS